MPIGKARQPAGRLLVDLGFSACTLASDLQSEQAEGYHHSSECPLIPVFDGKPAARRKRVVVTPADAGQAVFMKTRC
jgi:hypothetical protein